MSIRFGRLSAPRTAPLWLALVALCLAAPAHAARRLALVIGNDSYQHVGALTNARSDAKAVADELKAAGFDEVTLKQDLTQKMMEAALRDLKAHVAGGDDVVFYFSGHGVQFGGSNYLIPVDMTADNEAQVTDDAVPLQRILNDLNDAKANFSLAIIDACRTNPFKDSGRALGARGLAVSTPASGQMVMYSAGANQAALDNLGPHDANPHGVFTRVLIEEMRKPGVPAQMLLKSVQTSVITLARSIGREQVPALYDQSIGEFYFRPGKAGAGNTSATVSQPIHVPTAAELDESMWQSIRDSTQASDFNDYLSSYPKGMHVPEAQVKSRMLSRPAAPKSTPAATPASVPAALTVEAHRSAKTLAPGGPYPGWGTSSLLPGQTGTGTVKVNPDGSIDTYAPATGDRGHSTLEISESNHVRGTALVQLGNVGGIQRRYPDGSTSTQVTFEGQLEHGIIHGTYYDKFQTGQFEWTVAPQ